ncbi:pilus assembly FimT family protein [Aliikangiella maris]|uniref:Prepilin-type N-terminal cleavage/methylation domain-containing protein n=2 Tax=Aliikangiella maris TaxID=3162458 RepID=A0ABV3MTE4_9GAMM
MEATASYKVQSINTLNKGFSLIEILIAMAIAAMLVGIAIPYLGGSSEKFAKDEINRLLVAIEMVRDKAVIENREFGLNIDETGYRFLILSDPDEQQSAQGKRGRSGKDKGKGNDSNSASSSSESSTDKSSGRKSGGKNRQNNDDDTPKWRMIEDIPGLGRYDFPSEVEVNVAIDGEHLFKPDEDDVQIFEEDVNIFEDEEDEEIEPPQIYFLSSGEQNKFTLAVSVSEEFQSGQEEIRFYRIRGTLNGKLVIEGPLPGNIYQDIERDYTDYLEEDKEYREELER